MFPKDLIVVFISSRVFAKKIREGLEIPTRRKKGESQKKKKNEIELG